MSTPSSTPSPKSGGRRTALLAGGTALLVAGAAVGGVLWFQGGDGDGAAPYTIALPDHLLDGAYTRDADRPGPGDGAEDLDGDTQAKELGITDGKGFMGQYVNSKKQNLNVYGVSGRIADPRKVLDALVSKSEEGAARSPADAPGRKFRTVTPWTEFHPPGFDGVIMKCTSSKSTRAPGTVSVRLDTSQCYWADTSAVGGVQHMVMTFDGLPPNGRENPGATGEVMSAEALSEATAKVRNEAREKK
ncbi:hypothetical protein [Streptomyces huiliensis]|uniref:hypothetical protein n=1 Tax=Streptomyces huiliensis TaxID=2876027 RepID=UPI001CC09DBB|nr:hypothetical protein [Streptomyces huiliensis]MBZ4319737.1 hypothetical protein [Streptomyces huiliensis]